VIKVREYDSLQVEKRHYDYEYILVLMIPSNGTYVSLTPVFTDADDPLARRLIDIAVDRIDAKHQPSEKFAKGYACLARPKPEWMEGLEIIIDPAELDRDMWVKNAILINEENMSAFKSAHAGTCTF
jgi:hypothetical protein